MKYSIVIFTFISTLLLSQEVKFSKVFKLNKNDNASKLFENSDINIYYEFSSNDKDNSSGKTYKSICVLQKGHNFSKFVDVEKLKSDSLTQVFSQQGYAGAKEVNQLLRHKPLWSGIVLKKSKNDSLVRQNLVASKICQYEEIPPRLDWKLVNETKDVLGYPCRKATVTYRGRYYTAWYTNKLALNDGPYIFKGLPGLILEIEDADQYIHFKAIGIDKKPTMIFLDNSSILIKTTREKCRKFQENYFYNPGAFTQGKAYNVDGTLFVPRAITDKKYNPVELE